MFFPLLLYNLDTPHHNSSALPYHCSYWRNVVNFIILLFTSFISCVHTVFSLIWLLFFNALQYFLIPVPAFLVLGQCRRLSCTCPDLWLLNTTYSMRAYFNHPWTLFLGLSMVPCKIMPLVKKWQRWWCFGDYRQ